MWICIAQINLQEPYTDWLIVKKIIGINMWIVTAEFWDVTLCNLVDGYNTIQYNTTKTIHYNTIQYNELNEDRYKGFGGKHCLRLRGTLMETAS